MCRYVVGFISRAEKISNSLLFTTRLFYIRTSNFCEFLQALHRYRRTLVRNGIVHPFALFTPDNHTGITEDFHMVRQRRLRYIDFLQQLTAAFLACCQQFKNTNTVFIAKRFENGSCFLFVHLQHIHLLSTSIYIICNT